jgi:F-type H+-transporting ATPase subunit gamma
MASLSDIRNRIGSVKNTRQITRAMKLVAGAKLARATQAAVAAKPYQEALTRVLDRVVQSAGDSDHALLTVPENDTDVLVVLMTSDRGLCGGFNARLCRATEIELGTLKSEGKKVKLLCYGKKGRSHFASRGYDILDSIEDIDPTTYPTLSEELANRLVDMLVANEVSEVRLAFNGYVSVMVQNASFDKILPMALEGEDEDGGADSDYIYEPDGGEILGQLLPKSLRTRIYQAFLETQAGEQASRMTAMDAATRNAGDLIDSLTLDYNRARQAAITKELIEIVSGAEAL